MNPVKIKPLLTVAFLLYLKGLSVYSDDVICAPTRSTTVLSCRRPDNQKQKYQWSPTEKLKNRYSVDDFQQNCSLTIKDLKKTDYGNYFLYTLIDNDDDDDDDDDYRKTLCTITLAVTDLQVEVSSERITEGQKFTLTCKTSSCSSNKLNFIWYKNKQLLNLQHSKNKLNIGPVSSEDTGRYSCALKDYKSFPSAEKDINVLYAPRNTTASVRYLETGDVNLTCSSDAHPEPKYNWFKTSDTGQILGRGQSLTVETGNTGFFYCEATNTIGSQNSTVIRLTGIKSDVMFDRCGFIISLLSLLILLILMLIAAAGWRRRKNFRHPAGNEANTQIDSHVSSNIHGPAKNSELKKREESDDKDEVQYSHPYFSKNKNTKSPAVAADVQYAVIKVS